MATGRRLSTKKLRLSCTNEVEVNSNTMRKRKRDRDCPDLAVKFVGDADVGELVTVRKPGPSKTLQQNTTQKNTEEMGSGDVEDEGQKSNKQEAGSTKKGRPEVTRKKRISTKAVSDDEKSTDEGSVFEGDCDEREICEKPSDLCDEDEVAGDKMCSFRTPKKRDGMLAKARESASKHGGGGGGGTPKGKTSSAKKYERPVNNRTPAPISSGKKTPSKKTPRKSIATPKRVETITEEVEVICNKTPYSLRVRNKRAMESYRRAQEAVDNNSADSDYEEEESTSESDESEGEEKDSDKEGEEDSSSDSGKGSQKPACRRSLRFHQTSTALRKPVKDSNYVFTADEYFESRASKCVTSDRRLSRLATPRLAPDRLHDLLSVTTDDARHARCLVDYDTIFKRWMFALSQGFNVLAYGLGSKLKILQSFQREMLPKSRVLVVNGFFPSITIKEVVDTLAHDVLGLKQTHTLATAQAAVDWIEGQRGRVPRVFLIVHNIDGQMLRSDKTQRVLSRLAALPRVHLVASVDHINCPLMWDQSKLSAYNWLWEDVTSFAAYRSETSYESSLMVERTAGLALNSLINVYRSLTRNSRGVFRIILDRHLQDTRGQGIAFSQLYGLCREELLVTSDLVLRTILTEFLDHEMVKYRKDGEHLYVPTDAAVLRQFGRTVAEMDA